MAENHLIYQPLVSDTQWSEYPIQTIVYAIRGMIGTCVLIIISIALGFGVGTALVDHSLSAIFSGTFMFFETAVLCLSVSFGALVLPVIIAYTAISIAYEPSKWTLLIPFCLCVWVSFDAKDYQMNRSPMAKASKEFRQNREKSAKEKKKQPSGSPNQKPVPQPTGR